MAISRRNFIIKSGLALGAFSSINLLSKATTIAPSKEAFNFNISLAQWSLHKTFFSKTLDPLDFPVIAKTKYNIDAVEYVNQFFIDKAKDKEFLKGLQQRCNDNGVKSLLIMVDQEGKLSDKDQKLRKKAVEAHKKWIEAAKFLGCHSIRVNLHGDGDPAEWKRNSIESLNRLVEFSSTMGINILPENHGGYSSNASFLVEVIKNVNHKNCMALVDVANFCVRREKGDLWESPCVEYYDKYKGVNELLPFAKGVSAKTFDFDEEGNETNIDFRKMLKIVKKGGFKGYIGVEYEGASLSEDEGIKATISLLEKIRTELSQ